MSTHLFETKDNRAVAAARILLGCLFFVRGAQGLLGWFGGSGFGVPLSSFIHLVSVPAPLVLLAIVTEFFGGAALVAGFFTRIAAAGIAVDTVVTFILSGIAQAIYTDWLIIQGGDGVEYYVLAFALALVLLSQGGGAFSLDRLLFRHKWPLWRPFSDRLIMQHGRAIGSSSGCQQRQSGLKVREPQDQYGKSTGGKRL